jgi:hypothetical protein
LVRPPLFDILYKPRMMDDDRGAVGGLTGRGNRSTRRKPASVPLCPPQIPHDLNRAAAVESPGLTIMAWPVSLSLSSRHFQFSSPSCLSETGLIPDGKINCSILLLNEYMKEALQLGVKRLNCEDDHSVHLGRNFKSDLPTALMP